MIYCILGATGSGKSTFLQLAKNEIGAHLVEVGKMLRAKYPPEYFEGQAAPTKTAEEAWKLFKQGVKAGGNSIILVDGQPRDVPQVHMIMQEYPDAQFILFNCPTVERLRRLQQRDGGTSALDLSLHRLTGDYVSMFPVVAEVLSYGKEITVFNSGTDDPRLLLSILE